MDHLAMSGYGFYVWSSMGLGVLVFAWNALAPSLQRRDVMDRLASGDDEEDA